MSRKDFVALAREISKIADLYVREAAAEAVARACADSNPRFDRPRFMSACGLVN